MKKRYDSPEFDLYEVKILNNIMGDSKIEHDASDENEPGEDPFGG